MTYNVFSGTLNPTQSINLTSVAIWICDPDRCQTLIICSLAKLPGKFYTNPLRSFCAKL